MQGAQALLGKAYPPLSVAEKAAVDQWVFGQVAANYQAITPQWLQGQTSQLPVGFQAPSASPNPKS